MKICSKCKIEKDDDKFSKNQYHCISCNKKYYEAHKTIILANKKEYYSNNKDVLNEINTNYYFDNKEALTIYHKEYRESNKEVIVNYKKVYYKNNKQKITSKKRGYEKERYHNDPIYRFRKIISQSINKALKNGGFSKSGESCIDYLGYTFDEFIEYIEAQFECWMNWNNHGIYDPKTWDDNDQSTWKWQIDHIIPHASFTYTSMEDQAFKDCWALSNLRPYSAKQNILDGNRNEI
jgi:hypothetical protein